MVGFPLLLLACSRVDPDERLRSRDLAGAAAAWHEQTGIELDIAHPAATILANRAVTDSFVTMRTVSESLDAIALLERSPTTGLTPLDLSVATFEHLLGAVGALADGPTLAVVGRSESGVDRDASEGGALPWRGGRLIGWATKDFEELGRRVDSEAPPRLVTLRLRDEGGELTITFTPREKAWWCTAASDADAGARMVLAGNLWGESGTRATRQFYGRGVFRR